jgi:hypothetical protein
MKNGFEKKTPLFFLAANGLLSRTRPSCPKHLAAIARLSYCLG